MNKKLIWVLGIILLLVFMQGKKEGRDKEVPIVVQKINTLSFSTSAAKQVDAGGSKDVSLGCTDSDGGKNYMTKGTATLFSTTFEDVCINMHTLKEYYCEYELVVYVEVTNNDLICAAGHFNAPVCQDSDGGDNPYVVGVTSLGLSTYHMVEYTDKCDGTYNGNPAVLEYSCRSSDNAIMSGHISQAGYNCENGKLVPVPGTPTTTDPDCGVYPCYAGSGFCSSSGIACVCTSSKTWIKDNCVAKGDRCFQHSSGTAYCVDNSEGCVPNWLCQDWSTCVNSVQTRQCTDANQCGVTNNKPATSQSCTLASCGDGICGNNEDSTNCQNDCGTCSCGAWTECISGTQSRTCTGGKNCITGNTCSVAGGGASNEPIDWNKYLPYILGFVGFIVLMSALKSTKSG